MITGTTTSGGTLLSVEEVMGVVVAEGMITPRHSMSESESESPLFTSTGEGNTAGRVVDWEDKRRRRNSARAAAAVEALK